jgi:hypothetical protein
MKHIVIIFFLLIFQFGFSQIKLTGNEDTIVLNNFKFRHPMTVTSPEEISIVKDRIVKGIEPQASAFKALILAANSQLYFIPNPPDTMNIISGKDSGDDKNTLEMRVPLWNNCSAAYTSALAYTYTGEPKYAQKAIEVLNAWARKGTIFSGNGRYLQIGAWFTPMLYAADLLYYYDGWSVEDRAVFKKWWTEQCLVNTFEIMVNKLNNFKDAGILGTMAASIVFEDEKLLEKSLNELLLTFQVNPLADSKYRSWKMKKDSNGVYLTLEVDRNLGRSGLTYTLLSMTTTVQNMEMARYAGYDFWTAKTPQGANYQGVIEQCFKWSVAGETFPWYTNPDNDKTLQVNSYELANSNCSMPTSMNEWLNINRPVQGSQGDEYVTLNKGNIFNYTVTGIGETKTDDIHIFRQSNGIVNIKSSNENKVNAIIYNKLGIKLKQFSLSNGDNFAALPIDDFYIVQIENNTFKIIL